MGFERDVVLGGEQDDDVFVLVVGIALVNDVTLLPVDFVRGVISGEGVDPVDLLEQVGIIRELVEGQETCGRFENWQGRVVTGGGAWK